MSHLATEVVVKSTKKWVSFSKSRMVVRAGNLVESWDYLDSGLRFGQVPVRRAKEERQKIERNLTRSRRMIRWLVASNANIKTSYFFTATFSDSVTDFGKAVEVWERFRRVLRSKFPDFSYVCVPELQKRGVWHFHAVFFNLPSVLELREKFGSRLNSSGILVDSWLFYFTELWTNCNNSSVINRCSISSVVSPIRLSFYVTKYLTKETGRAVPPDRRCFFYGGRSLVRPTITESRSFLLDINNNYYKPILCPQPEGTADFAFSYRSKYNGRITYGRWNLQKIFCIDSG